MSSSKPVVLVTGCSAGGIGYELCVAFARAGCRVFATARRAEAMAGLEAHGCTLLTLDVTSDASINAAVAKVVADASRLDFLINNAGVGQSGPLAELPLERLRSVYETNVFSLVRVTQACVPHMVGHARPAVVVNVASIVGLVGTPLGGAYSSSKAAVVNLSDALRVELRPFNIRVVTLCPGAIRSHIGDNQSQRMDLDALKLYTPFRAAVLARATASQSPKSTPTDAFARHVVDIVMRPNPPPLFLHGHMSTLFRIMQWLPRFVRDWLLAKRFGLNVKVC